jgi:hypothetical protein
VRFNGSRPQQRFSNEPETLGIDESFEMGDRFVGAVVQVLPKRDFSPLQAAQHLTSGRFDNPYRCATR